MVGLHLAMGQTYVDMFNVLNVLLITNHFFPGAGVGGGGGLSGEIKNAATAPGGGDKGRFKRLY